MAFPMLNDFFLCAHRNIIVVLVPRVVYADCVGFLWPKNVKGVAPKPKWVDCRLVVAGGVGLGGGVNQRCQALLIKMR